MLNPVEAKHLLDAINESQHKPNKWGSDFLASIEEQIDDGRYLSDKQSSKLQQIYRHSQGG